MKVNPTVSAERTNYDGAEFYFCAKRCKQIFDADPVKFKPSRSKGFWNRYLDRLNKATGGKPPSCCS